MSFVTRNAAKAALAPQENKEAFIGQHLRDNGLGGGLMFNFKKKKMFRVIIAGGRDFNDYEMLCDYCDKVLANITDEIVIISGAARGADHLGMYYANDRGYKIQYFFPEWDKYGKSAGYRRNVQMAENADALIAFWDGKSRGTNHMINIANERGLKVRVKSY